MREKDKYCKDCGKYIDHEECTDLENILRTELAATKEKLALADKLADAAEERLKRWDLETYKAVRDALKAYREVGSE